MVIDFEDQELELVYFMLVDPAALVPSESRMMPRIGAGAVAYSLADPLALVEVAALKKLFLAKVFKFEVLKNGKTGEVAVDPATGAVVRGYSWKAGKVSIAQVFVDRLKSMLAHYKTAFGILPWALPWASLNAKLLGQKFEIPDAEEHGTEAPALPAAPAQPAPPGNDETASIVGAVGA